MKFGGTSVGDAPSINQVADIVSAKAARSPVVVVSAMARVTDALLALAGKAIESRLSAEERAREVASAVEGLRERHLTTARDLLQGRSFDGDPPQVEGDLDALFSELGRFAHSVAMIGELSPRSQDAIASFGERLSSILVSAAFAARGLPARLVDSRDFIITDSSFTAAAPDFRATKERARSRLLPMIEAGLIPVAQGFIGSSPDGATTTLGRGGSDFSAAIIGAALDAEAIEIWTDVDGLMTTDPRVVPEARRLRVISFAEAAELSYFGAKVLHPSTVLPAVELGIPVHIFNTKNPSCEGTLIVSEPRPSKSAIKSIAFKRGVTIVNITSTRMLLAYGFLSKVFEVFSRHRTSVDVVTTSEVSVSITLDSTEKLEAIARDLGSFGEVAVEQGKAIVCVVGDDLKFRPGFAARLFRAVEPTNVNMISQGASEINLTFVIDEIDVERVVRSMHEVLFDEGDTDTFA